MENTFYELDARTGTALVNTDFAVVQCLLQDDTAWGTETLRLAGIPKWIWQTFAWAGRIYPAKMLPGTRKMFWAQFGAGRPALAYRIERVADGRISVTPSAPIGSKGRWMLLLGMGVLMPLFLYASSRQVTQRSALMLPAFCAYLQGRLQKDQGD